MTTYNTCAEEDITEVKERSGGGGHWGDKETKVDKLKYRSFLSLSCVFIFNESTDSFYVNFSSHCCLHSSIIISLSCVFFFNESTDSCFVIVANYIFYWLLVHV